MKLQTKTILDKVLKKKRKNLTLKEKLLQDGKTYLMLKVEQELGQDIRVFLKYHYVDKKLSWPKVAKLAGVSKRSVREWGHLFGIRSRSKSVSTKIFAKDFCRTASAYGHIPCCLCQRCKAISGKCNFDYHHKKDHCVFGCARFTDGTH